jgi:hypothetical protein
VTQHASPLFNEIQDSLDANSGDSVAVRISLTQPEWYQPPDGGSKAWVRWLCWSLTDDQLVDVSEPVFHVVHGELSLDVVRADATAAFAGRKVVVDNA